MDCKNASLLISAFIDEEITPEDQILLEAHLDACPACMATYRRFRNAGRAAAAAAAVAVPPFFETRLLERIAQRQARPESIFDLIAIEKKLLFAFTALSLIVSAVTLNLTGTTESSALQSCVLGNSATIGTDLAATQNAELTDMASYLFNSSATKELVP